GNVVEVHGDAVHDLGLGNPVRLTPGLPAHVEVTSAPEQSTVSPFEVRAGACHFGAVVPAHVTPDDADRERGLPPQGARLDEPPVAGHGALDTDDALPLRRRRDGRGLLLGQHRVLACPPNRVLPSRTHADRLPSSPSRHQEPRTLTAAQQPASTGSSPSHAAAPPRPPDTATSSPRPGTSHPSPPSAHPPQHELAAHDHPGESPTAAGPAPPAAPAPAPASGTAAPQPPSQPPRQPRPRSSRGTSRRTPATP